MKTLFLTFTNFTTDNAFTKKIYAFSMLFSEFGDILFFSSFAMFWLWKSPEGFVLD